MIWGKAITVRYHGPTNTLASRWIARADHPIGRATVSYRHELNAGVENAQTAAVELIRRWNEDDQHAGTTGGWELSAAGWTHDDDYVFIATYGGLQ